MTLPDKTPTVVNYVPTIIKPLFKQIRNSLPINKTLYTDQNSVERIYTNISTAKKLSFSQLTNLKIDGFGKVPLSKKEVTSMKQSIDERVNTLVD